MKLRIAWAEVKARLGQLSAAVVVIGLGVALAAGTLLANRALGRSFADSLDALAGRADLQITAASGGPISERYLERVRAVPGVEAAAGLLSGIAHLSGEANDVVRVIGVDMLDDAAVRVFRAADEAASIGDPLVFLNQPNSAIVPASFAGRRGLAEGDQLEIETPTGRRGLTVRGLLDDSGAARAFGGTFIVMDLFAAQDALDLRGMLSQVDVVAPDSESTRLTLRAALPKHLSVSSVSDRKEDQGRAIRGFQLMLNAISVMGLVLAGLITSNRLGTIYQSRLWEIGVMRALGKSPRQLRRRLLLEASILSLLGVAIGIPLGWLFAQVIVEPVAGTMLLNFKEVVAVPSVEPAFWPSLLAGLAGVVSGVLAAWIPARRAANLSVVDVLARGRRRDPWPTGRVRIWLRRVAPPVAGVLAIFQLATGSGVLSVLALVSISLAGAVLIEPGLRVVTRLLASFFGSKRSVGLKDQSRFPSRAAGAAGILMAGLAIVLSVASMGESFEEFVAGQLVASRKGDLIVESKYDLGPDKPRIEEAAMQAMAEIPGIQVVGGEVTTKTRSADSDLDVGLLVADAVRFRRAGFGKWELETGEPNALDLTASGRAFLVNAQFLRHHHKSVGDRLRIMTPTGILERPIAGVTTASFLSQTGDVVMSRDLYRVAWGDSAVIRIFALVDDGVDPEAMKQEVMKRLGDRYSLQVITTQDLHDFMAQNVRDGFAFVDALAMLTLIVVAIGTADALAADVVERTRELGTLRTLGFSPRDISIMVLAQALAIGVVGASLGLLVGAGVGFSFVEGLLPDILGWQLQLRFTAGLATWVSIVGVLTCLIGAVLPAIRGARLSPVKALRYE